MMTNKLSFKGWLGSIILTVCIPAGIGLSILASIHFEDESWIGGFAWPLICIAEIFLSLIAGTIFLPWRDLFKKPSFVADFLKPVLIVTGLPYLVGILIFLFADFHDDFFRIAISMMHFGAAFIFDLVILSSYFQDLQKYKNNQKTAHT